MFLIRSSRRLLTNPCLFARHILQHNKPIPTLTRTVTTTTHPFPFLPRGRYNKMSSPETIPRAITGTLTSPPKHGQLIQHEGKDYDTVKEGLAYILTPREQEEQVRKGGGSGAVVTEARPSVFYNPIQQFNRDLSVLAIAAHAEHALAAKRIGRERKIRIREAERERKGRGMKRKREGEGEGEGEEVEGSKKADVGEKDAAAGEEVQAEAAKSAEWKPAFTILDALSASGLRALRYAKEIPCVTRIVANDLSGNAIESMKMNVAHNGIGDIVQPNHGDACSAMYSAINPMKQNKDGTFFGRYDVVDLDPYGTAAPFLDAAVQAVSDGGLLCVTCTDAGVFAAVGYPEKTFSLYGGVSIKGTHSHEAGLRLIIHALATAAAKYGLAIEPVLSLSIDFYVRIFVRVHRSPSEVKFQAGKTMVVYNCDSGCGSWKTQPIAMNRRRTSKNGGIHYHHALAQAPMGSPTCDHCGMKTHLAGPMWAGPLHNPDFIQRILDMLPGADRQTYPTVDRIEGMLMTALEEDLDMGNDNENYKPKPTGPSPSTDPSTSLIPRVDPAKIEPYPFYFMPSVLSKVIHTQTMSEDALRGALRNLGYRSTRSHAKPNSVRTDAPWDVIWEIMREWARQKSPVRADRVKAGTAMHGILSKKIKGEPGVKALKEEVLEALEKGVGLADLTTKIEAALYRAGAKGESAAVDVEMETTSDAQGEPETVSLEPSTLNVVFDEALGRRVLAAHRTKRLVRYQVNPRSNWGPLARAPVVNPKK